MLLKQEDIKLSADRIREWATEVSIDEILRALSVSEQRSADIAKGFQALRLLGRTTDTLEDDVSNLVRAQVEGLQPPSEANAKINALQPLRDALKNLPGDAFFLTSVAPGRADGYVAYLRHLEQLDQGNITSRPLRSDASHRRISRLQDRYIHALVQRFALVFMSIGLPTTYETARDFHADSLGEALK